jgi:hypothetical protein
LVIKTGTTAAIGSEVLSMALQVGANQHTLATKMKIRDLAVISQFENGYIQQSVDADGKIKNEMIIELSGTAKGLLLQDNNYITLDLQSLQSTANYQVYGIEAPANGNLFLNYTAQNLTGSNSQTKQYSLNATHKGLYISNNSSLEKIRLFTYDGNEVSYFPDELSASAREVNGVTQMADTLIEGDTLNQTIAGGASEFFYIPTEGFKGFEITTVGGVELTLISTEVRRF